MRKIVNVAIASLLFWLSFTHAFAQGVVISEQTGITNPEPSSLLEIRTSTKGFLPPVLTTQERDLIENPAAGLTIFNSTTFCLEFYNGYYWHNLCNGSLPCDYGPINGPVEVCAYQEGVEFWVNEIPGEVYIWAMPSDWYITSGELTNYIIVNIGEISGNLSVSPQGQCGILPAPLTVTVTSVPVQPELISGDMNPCSNATELEYSVPQVEGVTYTWVVPTGWEIISGNGTNAIIVNPSSNNDYLTVTPSNECGEGEQQVMEITVVDLPAQPSSIVGDPNPCSNASGLQYSVEAVEGIEYYWIAPPDWQILEGQNTNMITVNATFSDGDFTVTPSNSCGAGESQVLYVSAVGPPDQPYDNGTEEGENSILWVWSVSDEATHYHRHTSDDFENSTPTNLNYYLQTGLQPLTHYNFYVWADIDCSNPSTVLEMDATTSSGGGIATPTFTYKLDDIPEIINDNPPAYHNKPGNTQIQHNGSGSDVLINHQPHPAIINGKSNSHAVPDKTRKNQAGNEIRSAVVAKTIPKTGIFRIFQSVFRE